MMMGADHCAVDHLKLVWRNPGVVQSIQDVFPQSGKGPAAELPVDRRPLSELFGQVTPWCAGPCDPENSIQNKTMIGWLAPVRVTNSIDEPLEKSPLIVGYKVARQALLPRRDELESHDDGQGNPSFVNMT